MSVRTSTVAVPGRTARRVQAAERVKSGAAERAYARKRTRQQLLDGISLPDRSSTMAGRIPFVTAIIGLLGCGLALTLLLTTRAAEDSYLLGDMRSDNRALADERAALQREVAAADSAPELAERAGELGMIPAKDPARLVIGPGGEVTVIGTPMPAQGAPAPPLNGPPTTTPNPAPGQQAQGERVVPVQPGTPATAAPESTPPAVLAAPGAQVGAPSAPVVNPPLAQPDPPGQVAPPVGDGVPPAPSEAPVQAPAPQLVPDRVELAAAPADTPPPAPEVAPLPDAGPPSETPRIIAPEAGR
ncbi:hypothetical protein [Nocardia caishijiensis]|uniref:Septum formation initiator n=1 Tax=Nocardia caishijiensis TaxID=184756 RepID=A0ABQ6YGI1_9NOCA|nr:hypothetical protein [Nocardia caishijiensis]KAF0842455.1 hypothetical protein FNL39_11135 [Nocardia caishijiensis]